MGLEDDALLDWWQQLRFWIFVVVFFGRLSENINEM